MKKNKFRISKLFQPQYLLIWILLLMVLVFSYLSEPFRSPENLLEIVRSACINAVLVLG